jgi:hypothetical protein
MHALPLFSQVPEKKNVWGKGDNKMPQRTKDGKLTLSNYGPLYSVMQYSNFLSAKLWRGRQNFFWEI